MTTTETENANQVNDSAPVEPDKAGKALLDSLKGGLEETNAGLANLAHIVTNMNDGAENKDLTKSDKKAKVVKWFTDLIKNPKKNSIQDLVDQIAKNADLNGDGNLTLLELITFIQNNPLIMLAVALTLSIKPIVDFFQIGLTSGLWDFTTLLSTIFYSLIVFIYYLFLKGQDKNYQQYITLKNAIILQKDKIIKEKNAKIEAQSVVNDDQRREISEMEHEWKIKLENAEHRHQLNIQIKDGFIENKEVEIKWLNDTISSKNAELARKDSEIDRLTSLLPKNTQ